MKYSRSPDTCKLENILTSPPASLTLSTKLTYLRLFSMSCDLQYVTLTGTQMALNVSKPGAKEPRCYHEWGCPKCIEINMTLGKRVALRAYLASFTEREKSLFRQGTF